jgi:MYXO-CTERM domain-containing protein
MKISTQAKLISTALAAAAIAAPIAYGGSGTYPQLRTGEGFSFKAPSYWSIAPTPTVHINRSFEWYLGSGARTPAPTPMNRSLEVPAQYLPPSEPVSVTTGSDGFDWQDAGIGAAFVAGLGILGVGGLVAVRRRHELGQLDA